MTPDGMLIAIRVGGTDGAFHISVRDRQRGDEVTTFVPSSQRATAIAALGKRVIVYPGTWLWEETRIEVPDDALLPTLEEVRGIFRASETTETPDNE